MCKMTPISVRLNLKNFILISCAVLELLRKVFRGADSPPGEIGLKIFHSTQPIRSQYFYQIHKYDKACAAHVLMGST